MVFRANDDEVLAVADPPEQGFRDAGDEVLAPVNNQPARRDFVGEFLFSDKPIEQWLPADQAAVAQQVIDSMENPMDWRARMTNATLISSLFGTDFNDTLFMEPEMLKQMYGEQLSSTAGLVKLKNEYAQLDPFSSFKAAAASAAQKPALALKGLTAFTPGQGFGFDALLEIGSDYLLSLGDVTKKRQVEASLQGVLWPSKGETPWYDIEPKKIPEAINTWAANIGDYIPLMLMTRTGQAIGKAIGKPAGAAVAAGVALITGGPEPSDVATAPAIAGITEQVLKHVGGASPLIAIEAGGFLTRAEQLGIDKDIAEEYARIFGPSSGAIEYAQTLWNLAAFKRLKKPQRTTILKAIVRELGGAAVEGFEEVTQGGLENFLINKAIDAQTLRNPAFEAQKAPIFEDADRQFAIGAGLALVTRAGGATTMRAISTKDNIGVPSIELEEEVEGVTEPIAAAPEAAQPTPTVAPVAEPTVEAPIVPPEVTEGVQEAVEALPTVEPEVEPAPAAEVAKAKPKVQPAAEKPKVEAEKVKPVPPTKIISPGQAGPFKVTFKAAEGLPATRVIADPKVARSVQAAENSIAALKTKLKQAKVDKKTAVINATNAAIAKKEAQIVKLKARQEIKLVDTIAKAKERAIKIKEATVFKDELRRDAISMVRAIPKDLQKDFINRASKVTTLNGLKKLATEIETGVDRAEKREVVSSLKKTIKGIKPKRMLPEFGKPAKKLIDSFKVEDIKPETQAKVAELLDFARQVESSVDEDSVAWTKARHLIDIFASTRAKTVNIQDLPVESLEQINEVLTSLKFQNDFETRQREAGKAETIANQIETVKTEIQTKPSISDSQDASVSLGRAVGEKFITRHQNLESLTDKTTGGVSGLIGAERNSFTRFVYDTLNEGVDVQYVHTLEARDLLRSIMDKHGIDFSTLAETKVEKAKRVASGKPSTKWLNDKHVFGDKTFTTNEMLSIYMHSRNNHNLTVMLTNGFNKVRTGIERVRKGKVSRLRGFNPTLVDQITAKLTTEQKAFAREVGNRLMDGLNRDAINETSLKAENLEIATVDNYWPAVRDTVRKILGKKVVGIQSLIEGMGILKERIGTGNPLLLRGFFETVYTSNKNVAAYKGLAIPLREVKSILGDKSLQDSLKKAGYEDELNVMITQVERIEDNSAETGDIERAVGILIGGFAKSRFGINLKIAPRQQLSSTLINAYMDPKHFAEFRGLATKQILEEIYEISPQTQMRVESLRFDRDIGNNQLENDLMRYLTGQQNTSDKFLMGMKFFDTNAIADIYRATKAEVKEATGLDEKSDEFKTALKDRFEWTVRHTQPTWHPKDRSVLGTSPNPLARSLTMFMSQREKLVMMVANANQNYAKSKKTATDLKEVAQVWGTVGANMALFALYNFGWAALIKKKAQSFRDFLAQMAADTTGLFFFGRYVGEIIRVANARSQGKFAETSINTGPEQIVLQTIRAMQNYALAAEHFITRERYQSGPNARELKWKTEVWVATEALADAVAGVTGLPFSGPKEIVNSVKAHTVEEPRKRKRRKGR